MFIRYFVNDGLLESVSVERRIRPAVGVQDNFYRDHHFRDAGFGGHAEMFNELRLQFARRSFDFPTVSTNPLGAFQHVYDRREPWQPGLYRESRFELVDNFSITHGKHTISFGGNVNHVNTTESFRSSIPLKPTSPTLAPP